MSEFVVQATDQSFDQETKTDLLVLVDFWAPWCGPCRAVSPLLDELASEYKGKLKIVKVNVDDNQDTAARFQVMSIPTLLLIRKGKEIDKIIGAFPKNTIKSRIDTHLGF